MARGADALFLPSTRQRQSRSGRLVRRYQRRLVAAAADDPVVAAALLEVIGLVAGPQSLLRPAVALRVLAHGVLRSRRSATTADSEARLQPARR